MSIHSIEDYEVWNRAIDLTVEVYRLVKKLPDEERYALSDQMRRAVISIPSNIAEGQSKGSDKDFAKFLYIARGSESELRTQLYICTKLGYLKSEDTKEARELCVKIECMLSGLLRKISD